MKAPYGRSVAVTPARAVLDLYAGAAAPVRVHVRLRWATCPVRAVAAAVPPRGLVLEVGCGHGLVANYLALESGDRQVHGVDVDGAKVEAARAAAGRAQLGGAPSAAASFSTSAPGEVPDGPWDALVVVDVLYLLGPASQRRLLGECAARLAPGGVLVVKEMAPRPRWKAAWNLAQESLSVRVLGITQGPGRFSFISPAQLGAWMAEDGLVVAHLPLHRGYLHPHHLVVGRRGQPGCRPPRGVECDIG